MACTTSAGNVVGVGTTGTVLGDVLGDVFGAVWGVRGALVVGVTVLGLAVVGAGG